jgi:copper chaperone CopZ
MKKVFKLTDLDCANCASKMEIALRKIPGVTAAVVSFMTQRLTLEAEDAVWDSIVSQAQSAISKIEPGCKMAG